MIRIDELYDNTFWPWIQHHLPGIRMFYCDPPGHTSVDNLFNQGSDYITESDYIYFHDQEPVHVDIYKSLFDDVIRRNDDITPHAQGGIVTSEYNSKELEELLERYGWRSYYYFWHGWAALDWYRGYDKTFLIPRAAERNPKKLFMSPNRIIGGHRDHRVLFLYEVFKRNLHPKGCISAPRYCPVENIDMLDIAKKYIDRYPDILEAIQSTHLPKTLPGEKRHEMTSCWLDNFKTSANCMFYVPTETVYWGRRNHITEKTFKAIALEMPFILVAPAHSLEYLRRYGFNTFGDIIDESYDEEEDDFKRLQKVGQLLEDINNQSEKEKEQIWSHCAIMSRRNYEHFYGGEFEKILWGELGGMLKQIKEDYV